MTPTPSPETLAAVARRWARRLGGIVLTGAGCVSTEQRTGWWEALSYAEYLADHRTMAKALAWVWGNTRISCANYERHGWRNPTAALVELGAVVREVER